LWCNCGKASLSFQFKTSKNLKTAQIGYTVLKAPLPSRSSYCNATSQTHVRNSKILGKAKEKQKILQRKEGESNNKSLTERSCQHWPNHSNLWDQLPQFLSHHHHHHHHYREALEDQLQEKTFVIGLYLNTFEDPVMEMTTLHRATTCWGETFYVFKLLHFPFSFKLHIGLLYTCFNIFRNLHSQHKETL
jgi:hypothetical protein